MSYITATGSVRRNPPVPLTQPLAPATWAARTQPPSATVTPLAEPDRIALRLEFDALWHELERDRIARQHIAALEQQVIQAVGGPTAYYARKPARKSARSTLDLPDPARSPGVARLQGRTLRVPPGTTRATAAEQRKQQLTRRRRESASQLLASGNPRDLSRTYRSYHEWATGKRKQSGCACDCHGGRR